jgi:hypothetical protein
MKQHFGQNDNIEKEEKEKISSIKQLTSLLSISIEPVIPFCNYLIIHSNMHNKALLYNITIPKLSFNWKQQF